MSFLTNIRNALFDPNKREVREAITKAIRQGEHLTPAMLATRLGVSEVEVERSYSSTVIAAIRAMVDEAVADGKLDSRELHMIDAATRLYGITLASDTQDKLVKARVAWMIETQPIPTCPTSFLLGRGERCFISISAQAFEIRTRRVRTGYSGLSIRIPIAKGISYRMGTIKTYPQNEEYHHSFGTGEMAITDRRIMVSLPNKNMAINLNSLIGVEYFGDGLRLHKGSGKPVLITYPHNPSVAIALARILDGTQDAMLERPYVPPQPVAQPTTPRPGAISLPPAAASGPGPRAIQLPRN